MASVHRSHGGWARTCNEDATVVAEAAMTVASLVPLAPGLLDEAEEVAVGVAER